MASFMKYYEALYKVVFGLCTKAEMGYRPSWVGQFEWSSNLLVAIKTLTYWRHRLRNQNPTVVSKKLEKELNIKYTPLLINTIQQMVNSIQQILTEIQQTSREYRKDHLEALAQNYASQHNMSSQQAIIELISCEES